MTLDEAQAALNSKELNHKNDEKNHVVAEGLNVRGRYEKHESRGSSKSRSNLNSGSSVTTATKKVILEECVLRGKKRIKKGRKIRLRWL